ncbi:hypothetical protein NIES2119_27485 [[Phormidium ambiguum] IAM M-71]|uniref:Uncharacterized protein n=1 Tax=[Phormidium ambiguum] IAM M-71 TaxID=454136 RepID=A0A1U7I6T0_9CYAN|nr:hypothetical protein [Phormidium ambiguum]OKH31970.1 hypothetical protein NIES2119_27485 [Phormidium ambiguum IAM M-71]
MKIVDSENAIKRETTFLFDLDVEVNLIADLTEYEENSIIKQRKHLLSKLFDVTPEQVDNSHYWINL